MAFKAFVAFGVAVFGAYVIVFFLNLRRSSQLLAQLSFPVLYSLAAVCFQLSLFFYDK